MFGFALRVMSKLDRNRPMMSKQHLEACNGDLHSSGVTMCNELISSCKDNGVCYNVFLRLGLHVGFCFFLFRMMSEVNRNRPVMSNEQQVRFLSSFFPGDSCGVRTGQRDSAGIRHGNELVMMLKQINSLFYSDLGNEVTLCARTFVCTHPHTHAQPPHDCAGVLHAQI